MRLNLQATHYFITLRLFFLSRSLQTVNPSTATAKVNIGTWRTDGTAYALAGAFGGITTTLYRLY